LNLIQNKLSSTFATTNKDILESQEPQTSWYNSLFGQSQPEQPPGYFDGIFSLTRGQRMWGFFISIGMGVFCLFLCLMFLPNILFVARKFAVIYTLGTCLLLGSTMFIVGPTSQIQSMMTRERFIPSVVYFSATILTVLSAFTLQNTMIMLFLIFAQIFALAWYILSYIPFGQRICSGMFSAFTSMFG
jgi:hypothetical protein